MPGSKGNRYDPEFIRGALRLMCESGKSRSQVALDLGVSDESLRRWKLSYGDDGRKRLTPEATEHAEAERLKKELRISNEEREVSRKAAAFFAREAVKPKPVDVFRFIWREKACHSVKLMCRALKVSRSGYYKWASRKPSAREESDAKLREVIAEVHRDSGGTYGSPRVHAELRMGKDIRCSRKRVIRLMHELGIHGVRR